MHPCVSGVTVMEIELEVIVSPVSKTVKTKLIDIVNAPKLAAVESIGIFNTLCASSSIPFGSGSVYSAIV